MEQHRYTPPEDLFPEIVSRLRAEHLRISAMESCTGGLIASLLTDTEGASAVFPGGFVTYSNEGKRLCGVPEEVLARFGVYSPETALAMANACRDAYGTELSIGITGTFANADPANGDSVPGQLHFAVCRGERSICRTVNLPCALSRREAKGYAAAQVGQTVLEILQREER